MTQRALLWRKGLSVLVDDGPGTDDWGFWGLWADGVWEPELLSAIDRLLPEEGTLLDIGAWVGPVAIWAAKARGATVVALEPDPVAFAQLQQNVALNGLETRVMTIPAAASDRNGTAPLYHVGGLGSSSPSLVYQPVPGSTEVGTIDIRELIRSLPRLDLIKCDIEGGECLVLPLLSEVARCPLILSTHIDRCTDAQYKAVFAEIAEHWDNVDELHHETFILQPRAQ